MSLKVGLARLLGIKEVQPILCYMLGSDLSTWLSIGKASIVTVYRVSRALGAHSTEVEQAIREQAASSVPLDVSATHVGFSISSNTTVGLLSPCMPSSACNQRASPRYPPGSKVQAQGQSPGFILLKKGTIQAYAGSGN